MAVTGEGPLWCLIARFSAPPRPHKLLYRLTGGLLGSRFPAIKLRVLLLTTTGRKSGSPRTTPVMYYRDGDRLILLASNNGKNEHPAWFWNLKSDPAATVQIGRTKQAVVAEEARPEEYERLWPLLVERDPVFAQYEKRTARKLPIVILRPAPPARAS